MNVPQLHELTRNTITESCIRHRYPDFYQHICCNFPSYLSWVEKLYWYYNGLTEHPKCIICGNNAQFHTFFTGYKKYCGQLCANRSKEKLEKSKQTCLERYGDLNYNNPEKSKQTCLERYGVENPSQLKTTKDQIKQTCLERYGVENPSQSTEIREKISNTNIRRYGVTNVMQNKDIRDKAKQTCLKRYGVEYPSMSPDIHNKIIGSFNIKYGVDWITQSEEFKNKAKQTCLERYGVTNYGYLNSNDLIIPICRNDNELLYKCPNPECNKCVEKTYWCPKAIHNNRIEHGIEPCTKLLSPDKWNGSGTTQELIIRKLLDDNNVKYECNNRTILDGKEVDIYIPEYKIAIECNGIYWHSTSNPSPHPNSYHFNKWKECSDKGIQLITVWQDQIITNPDIISSIILSKLGIYRNRYYARQCTIRELNAKECNQFLENNHLQGSTNSKVRYGLYYNDELVSVMTFGLKRKCMGGKNEWELHRYCNKRGIQVVGGASKLFKHFIKEQKPSHIESFSSNDISNGDLYLTLGFECLNSGYGSYWYIDKNMNRYHRYNFRKDLLIREGYDGSKSESQIMKERGFYKIFDCGQTKWIYKKESH